ncbi:MAG: DUF4349 domain-containing protein [Solirubrobacterales bacterium]|nr:DUF4349 domain-containing protein [Solirubrobacterales bacterium]
MDATETTAVIDRALAGEPPATGDPLERELAELTLALAAEAPAPDPDFARQLDERAALGFPRDGWRARLTHRRARAAAALRRDRHRSGASAGPEAPRDSTPRGTAGTLRRGTRRLTGAPPTALAGALACVAIGLVAVAGLGGEVLDRGDGDAERSVADGAASTPAEAPSAAAGGAVSDGETSTLRMGAAPESAAGAALRARSAVPPQDSSSADAIHGRPVEPAPPAAPGPDGRDFAPGTDRRRIERSAALTLAAPDERLDRVAAGVERIADRHGGFVLTSELAVGDDGAASGGEFELRIPTGRLDAALADLGRLAQVRSRTTSGRDITAATVTAADSLQAARAERRGLLTRLEQAASDNEADALRFRLDANAREIDRLEGRVRALRLRADYANVAVTLQSDDPDALAPAPGADDGLGGAIDDAAGSLSDALELAIRALGILAPLALLAALAWLAARALRRRRRESALRESA